MYIRNFSYTCVLGYFFRQDIYLIILGRLCLPQGFKDFELLEAEADFYQITPLSAAIQITKQPTENDKSKAGFYVEILDFEESAYFYRFYSDPPQGIHTELKNGGLVISGAKMALLTLPLPEKTLKDISDCDAVYRTVNLSSSICSKMAIIHHLQGAGWQLVTTSFANNTDSDGSYMVHKYMWYLPAWGRVFFGWACFENGFMENPYMQVLQFKDTFSDIIVILYLH